MNEQEVSKLPVSYPQNLLMDIFGRHSYVKEIPISEEEQKLVDEALAALSEKEQTVMLLNYRDHLTDEQIAEKFGIDAHTVRDVKASALRMLRHPGHARRLKDIADRMYVEETEPDFEPADDIPAEVLQLIRMGVPVFTEEHAFIKEEMERMEESGKDNA